MTRDEIYRERWGDLKALVFALQSAVELFGASEAKRFAKLLFERYAHDRFVTPFEAVPRDERWQRFREVCLAHADGVQYSIESQSENEVRIRYHWCTFWEIMKDHGLADFVPLYCETDYATCRAVHPGITMTRTQTLAEGGDHCDHCWRYEGRGT
jgi:hypothetical protein